jgi:hypothetical protein
LARPSKHAEAGESVKQLKESTLQSSEEPVWKKPDRKTITDALIRVAQDSKFQLDSQTLLQFTSEMLMIHPFEVYEAVGSMDNVERIAQGTHPAVKQKK